MADKELSAASGSEQREEPSKVAEEVVNSLKSRGLFDQFRKECLEELESLEAYRLLKQRVENHVASFLSKYKWTEKMSKNSLRDNLRMNINRSEVLLNGIDRLVDQILASKIDSFSDRIGPEIDKYFGIEQAEDPAPGTDTNEDKAISNEMQVVSSQDNLTSQNVSQASISKHNEPSPSRTTFSLDLQSPNNPSLPTTVKISDNVTKKQNTDTVSKSLVTTPDRSKGMTEPNRKLPHCSTPVKVDVDGGNENSNAAIEIEKQCSDVLAGVKEVSIDASAPSKGSMRGTISNQPSHGVTHAETEQQEEAPQNLDKLSQNATKTMNPYLVKGSQRSEVNEEKKGGSMPKEQSITPHGGKSEEQKIVSRCFETGEPSSFIHEGIVSDDIKITSSHGVNQICNDSQGRVKSENKSEPDEKVTLPLKQVYGKASVVGQNNASKHLEDDTCVDMGRHKLDKAAVTEGSDTKRVAGKSDLHTENIEVRKRDSTNMGIELNKSVVTVNQATGERDIQTNTCSSDLKSCKSDSPKSGVKAEVQESEMPDNCCDSHLSASNEKSSAETELHSDRLECVGENSEVSKGELKDAMTIEEGSKESCKFIKSDLPSASHSDSSLENCASSLEQVAKPEESNSSVNYDTDDISDTESKSADDGSCIMSTASNDPFDNTQRLSTDLPSESQLGFGQRRVKRRKRLISESENGHASKASRISDNGNADTSERKQEEVVLQHEEIKTLVDDAKPKRGRGRPRKSEGTKRSSQTSSDCDMPVETGSEGVSSGEIIRNRGRIQEAVVKAGEFKRQISVGSESNASETGAEERDLETRRTKRQIKPKRCYSPSDGK